MAETKGDAKRVDVTRTHGNRTQRKGRPRGRLRQRMGRAALLLQEHALVRGTRCHANRLGRPEVRPPAVRPVACEYHEFTTACVNKLGYKMVA